MRQNGNTAEQGMISLMVTMIMIVVITLIVLGISQVTRSNRREALDRQLSTQAYYAAESGLNQAAKFFAANPAQAINTNGNCTQFISSVAPNGLGLTVGTDNVLNSSTNTRYTCLMVNSTPTTLQKTPLTEDSNAVWHVKNAAANNFTSLDFKWSPNSKSQFTGANNTCSATAFTAYANWKCAFGVLRVDLVDVHGTVATGSGTGLEAPAKAIYLVPTYTASGVNTAVWGGGNAQVVNVKCTTSLCDINLTFSGVSNDYFARLSIAYQSSDSVQLSAGDASGAVKFAGGQAVIDVTGKSQDELRRVQARIPLTLSGTPTPNFALQTTDTICKQLLTSSGATTDLCP